MRTSAGPSIAHPSCCTARPRGLPREHRRARGTASPFTATRYHSLTVVPETIPDDLVVTGRTDTGIVMAMMHRDLPIHGVQFHPESVLTQGGHRMLANWLTLCGIDVPEPTVAELRHRWPRPSAESAATRPTVLPVFAVCRPGGLP